MKARKPKRFTVSSLATYLKRSRSRTLALIAQAGITLTHVEPHYSDDRPRKSTRREWRELTSEEVDRVLTLVRAKQGAR